MGLVFLILFFSFPNFASATMVDAELKTHEGVARFNKELILNLDAEPVSIGEGFLAQYRKQFDLQVNKADYKCTVIVLLNLKSKKTTSKLTINADSRRFEAYKIDSGTQLIFYKDDRKISLSCYTKTIKADFILLSESLNKNIGLKFEKIKPIKFEVPDAKPLRIEPVEKTKT